MNTKSWGLNGGGGWFLCVFAHVRIEEDIASRGGASGMQMHFYVVDGKINEFGSTTTTRSLPCRTLTIVANAQNATIEASQGGVGWSFGAVAGCENEHSQQHTNQTLHTMIKLRSIGIYDNRRDRTNVYHR